MSDDFIKSRLSEALLKAELFVLILEYKITTKNEIIGGTKMRKLFTSESVTEGHPDKLCDYISDSVLDEYFTKDPNARVACETVAGKDLIVVTGEITSIAEVDIEAVVRNAVKEVGFDNSDTDIDYKTCKVLLNISKQSPDIALRS